MADTIQDKPEGKADTETASRTYSAEEFKQVIAERQAAKEKARTLEATLTEKLAAEKKAADELALKNGEFEKLALAKAAEAEAARKELEQHKAGAAIEAKRFDVKFAAQEAGANDAADVLALIDLSKVTDAESVKVAIEALKTSKPYLFKGEQHTGVATAHAAGKQPLTRAELLKSPVAASRMQRENPAQFNRIMSGS
jgi:hypothetical protein